MNLLHTIPTLSKLAGGPSRTVTALCSELAYLGNSVEILTKDHSCISKNDEVLPYNEHVKVSKIATSNSMYEKFFAQDYYQYLLSHLKASNKKIIHDHGVWLPSNHASARIASLYGLPFVISPRGMLEPWALEQKKFKKKIAWWLYQNQNLKMATLLHATSEQEAQNLRILGLTQPISVIPNGFNLNVPSFDKLKDFRTIKHKFDSKRTLLFLSRIHRKKGLMNLADAWSIVKPINWKVIIAGPDENNHKFEVEEKLKKLKILNDFEFIGPVSGNTKIELFKKADLFILPTYSENFGVVIAEALAMGIPCITTKNAPWENLVKFNCGWWIDVGVEPLVKALKDAFTTPKDQITIMGENGYKYAINNFKWPKIALQMQDVYKWILNKGSKPKSVYLD